MRVLNNFDFLLNEIKNVVLRKLSTAPIGVVKIGNSEVMI